MSDAERGPSARQKRAQQDFEDDMQEPEQEEDEIVEDEIVEDEIVEDEIAESRVVESRVAESGIEEEAAFSLPAHGILYAIITGIVAGALGALLSVAITFLNAPLFQQAASAGSSIAYNTALAIVGIQCLNFLLSVFVCFLGGYFVGKMAIQRRLGFYAGAIAGVLMYVVSLLLHYIPNYPGDLSANTPTESAGTTAGIITIVIFLFVWGFIGGLLGMWGAWMATSRHPYYAATEE